MFIWYVRTAHLWISTQPLSWYIKNSEGDHNNPLIIWHNLPNSRHTRSKESLWNNCKGLWFVTAIPIFQPLQKIGARKQTKGGFYRGDTFSEMDGQFNSNVLRRMHTGGKLLSHTRHGFSFMAGFIDHAIRLLEEEPRWGCAIYIPTCLVLWRNKTTVKWQMMYR